MATDAERIKQKLDIVEFLKSAMTLSPAGKNFKGLCPFHQEKNPSFMVSSERQSWHCFGCGEGGDVIKFAMLYENLDFPEALRVLAEKAGIDIAVMNQRDQRQFTVLYDINTEAQKSFAHALWKNNAALVYLRDRGLKDETIREFGLGFSPGGDALVVHLIKKGYAIEDIHKAGIAYRYRGLNKDRFDGRIVFPIMNDIGNVVGFTGRIFNREETDEVPKYMNSPETLIFIKSKLLYGLHKSKPAIVKSRTVFLVEGQMDVLMVWQAGVRNVVAVSGTGLTGKHLMKLRRIADTVIVSFDNDASGLKALERSLDIFSTFDFHIKAASLGTYKDPAEMAEADPQALKKAITDAQPVFTYLFETYFRTQNITDIMERKNKVRHLLGKIQNLASTIERDMWIKELSQYSGIAETALTEELSEMKSMKREHMTGDRETLEQLPPRERIEHIVRRLLLVACTVKELWQILEKHEAWFPEQYREILKNPEDEKINLLEMESSYLTGDIDPELLKTEFRELMCQLEIEFLKKKQSVLKEKMRTLLEDDTEVEVLAEKFYNIAGKIDTLIKKNT